MMASRRKKQINVDIGRNIRTLRESVGMSRETFSEEIGISSRFLASVEAGFVGVSFETLDRICQRFLVSADVILWGKAMEPSGYFDPILSSIDKEYYPLLADTLRAAAQMLEYAEKRAKQSPEGQ